ncbi:MAG: hypothetical protein JSR48_14215 [Verrucomicrobia bacterium]|nr:hypothetical protein [Verrucomicrobiota bacterium]
MRPPFALAAAGCFLIGALFTAAADLPYSVADTPWTEPFGNHRVRVHVDAPADAVQVHIPWRRRDQHPEQKAVIVVDAATNRRVTNVIAASVTRETGDLVFQPATAPGDYWVYFLPYKYEGWENAPTAVYTPPAATADPKWAQAQGPAVAALAAGRVVDLPAAQAVEIQAINDFNRFDPMEVVATAEEMRALLAAHAGQPYLVFAEDRHFPIRMTDALPLRWIKAGPSTHFHGAADRGEFYAFQLGLFAANQPVNAVALDFSDLRADDGAVIPASAFRCFNLGGLDWLGRPFRKTVNVAAGAVQALWIGVQVPADARGGHYRGTVRVRAANAPATTVDLNLVVSHRLIADAGDNEPWRHSRLRWLDSTIGLDEAVFPPYTPVTVRDRTLGVLGREFTFTPQGLPASIRSHFSRNVDATDGPPREILAEPVRFVVDGAVWNGPARLTHQAPGAVAWTSTSQSSNLDLTCEAKLECDGYVNYRLTLHARQAADLRDVALELPIRADVATYLMGMGRKGGLRPKEWSWQWDLNRANNQLWIGDINAGLSLKLKDVEDHWDLYNLRQTGLYRDWANGGKGGCTVREADGQVLIRAYAGPRHVNAGEDLHFNFGLLITPVRSLDPAHWDWRHSHMPHSHLSVREAKAAGMTIVNIHQSEPLNRYINYPFLAVDPLTTYIREAHAAGIKVKLYYTVREQSNYTAEFWALRSLGDEIFLNGPGFHLADQFSDQKTVARDNVGSSWLREHVITGYVPAWHEPLGPGDYDAAIATTGLSRWHNYYLEGINWLIRHTGADGIYLDGIGYDREIMKRVRKVMQRAKPGTLIDFHSGNNFQPEYGLGSCANQYMELFPYIDSLWFGEAFNYNESPDYYLVELAGLPYGLFSEMLQDGGNAWRGMLYGMSNRYGWQGDPRPIFRLWDLFGIKEARMMGYWDPACPVKTGRSDILATVYRKPGRSLIVLASWAADPAEVRLSVDWKALGLDPAKTVLTAPSLDGLQEAKSFGPQDPIPILPAKGAFLIAEEK